MHVNDLDAVTIDVGRRWMAIVTISVVDDLGNPVVGATVDGDWRGAGSSQCTTVGDGTCLAESPNLRSQVTTWTVTDVDHASLAYDSGSNTDPDADSDGTVISIDSP